MDHKSLNCLFIYPPFTSQSFWNYRETCHLVNARYPAAPLGLATVAAMLPDAWNVRLVDCNVEELSDSDIEWADIVFSGGMIAQQRKHLELIDRVHALNKIHVIGGPDVTESPHLYEKATHLILGEAEVTLPTFLEDFAKGEAKPIYRAGEEKADVTKSPIPRFDLLQFDKYLHVGVQYARGCPFKCEFCDIIELFGRVPRMKDDDQILKELETLYHMGYRGHVDFVDDNFIGNKKAVKNFLPKLKTWLEKHNWPFEFSTEASMNLADDKKLMEMMQEVGFSIVFVGIESPDEETLVNTQKRQNTRRSIPESIQEMYRHGIMVNAGYIVGFDGEKGGVANGVIRNIEETAIPVNMVGLLYALPDTQLSRRLKKEGRLLDNFEIAEANVGDQCLAGLNFVTDRPRVDILTDYKTIVETSNAPENYFGRVNRMALALDCSKKRLKMGLKNHIRDLKGFGKLIYKMGIKASYRKQFWKSLFVCLTRNPRAVRYAVAMMALYLHFYPFTKYVVDAIAKKIEAESHIKDSVKESTLETSPALQAGA